MQRVVGAHGASPVCRDVVPGILFLVALFGIVTLGASGASSGFDHLIPAGVNVTAKEQRLVVAAAAYGAGGGAVTTMIYYLLMACSPLLLIIGGQVMIIATLAISAALFFHAAQTKAAQNLDASGLLIASAIQAGMALLILLWLCCIRKRIAFTAAVLGQVARTLARLPELIVLQFVATVVAVVYAFICVLAALKANDLLDEHYESIGVPRSGWSHLALNIGAFLALAWGGLVIVNISFVTTAGGIATCYFEGPAHAGCRACCGSLGRALSFQFGSIAFGSLIVAMVNTLVYIIRLGAEQARHTDNGLLKLIFCCCLCCMQCFERTVEWLTSYAFVYVAIYGTSFLSSGRAVMGLLGKSGVGAVATSTLIDPVLTLGTLLGCGAGCALGYVAARGWNNLSAPDNFSEFQSEVVMIDNIVGIVAGGVAALAVASIGLAPVDAGAKSLFVCYAEEPQKLALDSPALAAKISEAAGENRALGGGGRAGLIRA